MSFSFFGNEAVVRLHRKQRSRRSGPKCSSGTRIRFAQSYFRVGYEPQLRDGAAVSPPVTPIGCCPLAGIYVYWLSANTLVAGILSAAARSTRVVYGRLTASGNAYQFRTLRS